MARNSLFSWHRPQGVRGCAGTASPGSCAGPRWGHEDTGVRPQIPLRVLCSEIVSGSGSHTGCAGGAGVAGAGKAGAHGLPDAVLCSACPSKGAARGPTCWPRRSLGLEHHLTEKQVGEAAQSQAAQCACPEMPQPGGPDPGEQRVMAHSDSACIFYASIQVFLCACSVPGQRAQSE